MRQAIRRTTHDLFPPLARVTGLAVFQIIGLSHVWNETWLFFNRLYADTWRTLTATATVEVGLIVMLALTFLAASGSRRELVLAATLDVGLVIISGIANYTSAAASLADTPATLLPFGSKELVAWLAGPTFVALLFVAGALQGDGLGYLLVALEAHARERSLHRAELDARRAQAEHERALALRKLELDYALRTRRAELKAELKAQTQAPQATPVSADELARQAGVSKRTAYRRLASLRRSAAQDPVTGGDTGVTRLSQVVTQS